MKGKYILAISLFLVVLLLALQPSVKSPSKVSIVFYSNGGSYTPTIQVYKNQVAHEPISPVRITSEFAGWYTTNTFDEGTKFDFKNQKVTKSITLYAKWEKQAFKIVYDLAGGEFPEDAESKYVHTFDYDSLIVYVYLNDSKLWPKHASNGRFQGFRTIPQSEYVQLDATEQSKYPYIESIKPKEEQSLFDETNTLTLYAYYRNFK